MDTHEWGTTDSQSVVLDTTGPHFAMVLHWYQKKVEKALKHIERMHTEDIADGREAQEKVPRRKRKGRPTRPRLGPEAFGPPHFLL